jgi:selenide,water dikinase
LFLTKPLGVGIITTALKGELISAEKALPAINCMAALNDKAAQAMQEVGVNAATDITGFGFLGHLYEMCAASGVTVEVFVRQVPVFDEAAALAARGAVPGGAKRNAKYLEQRLKWMCQVDEIMLDILCDPQTSGGLLIAVSPGRQQEFARQLAEAKVSWWLVGQATEDVPGAIRLL